jgi:hypothetical protein
MRELISREIRIGVAGLVTFPPTAEPKKSPPLKSHPFNYNDALSDQRFVFPLLCRMPRNIKTIVIQESAVKKGG